MKKLTLGIKQRMRGRDTYEAHTQADGTSSSKQYYQDDNPRLAMATNADGVLKKICLDAANDAEGRMAA